MSDLRASVRRHLLRLTLHGRATTVALDSIVDAASIDSIAVRDLAERGGATFALLVLSGPSRGPGGQMGYCGAGREEYVVWLRVTRPRPAPAWYRAGSCFHNTEESEWTTTADSIIGSWQTLDGPVRLAYGRTAPDRGAVIMRRPGFSRSR